MACFSDLSHWLCSCYDCAKDKLHFFRHSDKLSPRLRALLRQTKPRYNFKPYHLWFTSWQKCNNSGENLENFPFRSKPRWDTQREIPVQSKTFGFFVEKATDFLIKRSPQRFATRERWSAATFSEVIFWQFFALKKGKLKNIFCCANSRREIS